MGPHHGQVSGASKPRARRGLGRRMCALRDLDDGALGELKGFPTDPTSGTWSLLQGNHDPEEVIKGTVSAINTLMIGMS